MSRRREALYGKKNAMISNADTEGKQVRPKLTGGDRAAPDNPNRKPPKLGGK